MESRLEIELSVEAWDKLFCVIGNEDVPKGLSNNIAQCKENQDRRLPYDTILEFSRWKCKNKQVKPSLTEILRNSICILPHQIDPPPNPELQLRLQKLRAQEESRVYNKMVSNVTTPTAVATKPTAKVAVISGINFAVTVLATVFGTTFVLQSLVPNLGIRVGIGLAVASLLVCIEIFLAVRAVEKAESEISKNKSTLQLNKGK